MTNQIAKNAWAFDAEWVPDPPSGRRVYGLPDAMPDREVIEEMWRRGGATEEEPRPYLKTVLCRVVSVAMIARHEENKQTKLHLWSLPNDRTDPDKTAEVAILRRFLDGVQKQSPLLIGFNSRAADIRIIVQRSIGKGIRAPAVRALREQRWDGIRYFDHLNTHVDLMDIVGGLGNARPSLHEIAMVCGIPGKFDIHGHDVVDLWLDGRIDEIVAYNEFDAVTTYLLWLRTAHLGGWFTNEQYEDEQCRLRQMLNAEVERGRAHLARYVAEWDRLQATTTYPGPRAEGHSAA